MIAFSVLTFRLACPAMITPSVKSVIESLSRLANFNIFRISEFSLLTVWLHAFSSCVCPAAWVENLTK